MGLVGIVFVNDTGDTKIVLDGTLLNTQYY